MHVYACVYVCLSLCVPGLARFFSDRWLVVTRERPMAAQQSGSVLPTHTLDQCKDAAGRTSQILNLAQQPALKCCYLPSVYEKDAHAVTGAKSAAAALNGGKVAEVQLWANHRVYARPNTASLTNVRGRAAKSRPTKENELLEDIQVTNGCVINILHRFDCRLLL
jgi:hypothetical protein